MDLNPDFAIGVRTETNEAAVFSTKKVRAQRCLRSNVLRKKKSGIARRIPRPIAISGLNINPDSCALVTIDIQNDFTLPGSPAEIAGTNKIVPNIVKLLKQFRKQKSLIVHVIRLYLADGSNVDLCRRDRIREGAVIVRPGTRGSELVKNLMPDSAHSPMDWQELMRGKLLEISANEYLMYKPRWGAFYQTPMESFLHNLGIDSLLFCGCNFPNCPRTSIYEASERDFKVALAKDACSGLYDKGIEELKAIGVEITETENLITRLTTALP